LCSHSTYVHIQCMPSYWKVFISNVYISQPKCLCQQAPLCMYIVALWLRLGIWQCPSREPASELASWRLHTHAGNGTSTKWAFSERWSGGKGIRLCMPNILSTRNCQLSTLGLEWNISSCQHFSSFNMVLVTVRDKDTLPNYPKRRLMLASCGRLALVRVTYQQEGHY